MDVVYPLIKTKDNNLELKYSLRSLKNIDHDKVFIIGHKPNWVCNVEHIPFVDSYRKGLNTIAKLRLACENKNISEDFVWMMDDVYILNKIDKLGYYAVGKLEERIKNFTRATQFTESISALKEIFLEGYDYDSHTPIVFNKKKMLNILNKYQGIRGSKRSWYCNYYKIKPTEWVTIDYKYNINNNIMDCKCYDIRKLNIKEGQNFLSSSDEIIKNQLFRKFMDGLYPTVYKYEDLSCKYIWMEKVKVHFIKSLFPYKKGEQGEMKTDRAIMWESKGFIKILDQEEKINEKEMMPVLDKSMANRKTTVETKVTEKEVSQIEKLRIKYQEKLGKTVPNNKKNDADWIQSKIDAL